MTVIDLGGEWRIESADGALSLAGMVPGGLFGALEASGHFGPGGIAWRENNRACQDIADREYRFSRGFELPAAFAADDEGGVFLEADGLDTLAEIAVNGVAVGRADNMHRRWAFPLGGLLRPGANRIEIRFANALDWCRRERGRRELWHSYADQPDIAFPGFNMIRKSHCSFGWDWGPIVPDVGVWRPIRLVRYGAARLAGLEIRQDHRPGEAGVEVELRLQADVEYWGEAGYGRQAPPGGPGAAFRNALKQAFGGKGGAMELVGVLATPAGQAHRFAFDAEGRAAVLIKRPELWWPNGLGAQPLYRIEVSLLEGGRTIHGLAREIGLRTLTVRREPDQWGESFEFVVNGLPIFARGADYIPEGLSLPVPPERTERLVRDCAAANFNCLRVWGGGVYPDERFYALCDRHGLVVWQDLMFACALYDIDNPAFLDNVLAEVRDNLTRIRHHACLGLVCGNNEMEVAFVEWGLPDRPRTRSEYLLQYQHYFKNLAAELCPDTFYWPASPSSGGDFAEPNRPDRGDCHFWTVWHGGKDFAEYARHYFRFMSEFGFESFPALKTIESFTLPADRRALGPVMEDHQRCVGGNAKIIDYICRDFHLPADLSATVYLSWLSQAEALRHGIQHWRRNRGRCMGSVYWQLNDNWPGASWSSIDAAGRWKALHYEAKRSYAPALLSVCFADGAAVAVAGNGHFAPPPSTVELHLSNEGRAPAAGRLDWRLVDTDGAVADSGGTDFEAPAFADSLLLRLDLGALVRGREAPRRLLLFCDALLADGGALHACQAFVPHKHLELAPARLACRLEQSGDGFELAVSADKPALFVEIDHADFDLTLSDNYFCLDGRGERRVRLVECRASGAALRPEAAALSGGLRLRSLRDCGE